MIVQLVEALLRSVQGSTVTEIEYEVEGQRLRIVREPQGVHAAALQPAASAEHRDPPPVPARKLLVCAPMHGTFYRSSAPGESPIVDVGQQVEAGQQVALLEAMKMLHAVEAEQAGRIVKVLVESGSAVEPGTPLFEMEVTEMSGV